MKEIDDSTILYGVACGHCAEKLPSNYKWDSNKPSDEPAECEMCGTKNRKVYSIYKDKE